MRACPMPRGTIFHDLRPVDDHLVSPSSTLLNRATAVHLELFIIVWGAEGVLIYLLDLIVFCRVYWDLEGKAWKMRIMHAK